jgi:hypothetical protein
MEHQKLWIRWRRISSLDHVKQLTRSKHEAHGGEDNHLATAMDPWSKVDYSLIALEASMVMKKTSGGDSPLRHGAGKSFWTLPISGRWRRWITICFWKSDRVFRFFPLGGLYRRRGSVRGGPRGPHHRGARASPRPRPLVVCSTSGSSPSLLRCSGSSFKYLDVWLLFHPIPRIFPV